MLRVGRLFIDLTLKIIIISIQYCNNIVDTRSLDYLSPIYRLLCKYAFRLLRHGLVNTYLPFTHPSILLQVHHPTRHRHVLFPLWRTRTTPPGVFSPPTTHKKEKVIPGTTRFGTTTRIGVDNNNNKNIGMMFMIVRATPWTLDIIPTDICTSSVAFHT